MRSDLSFHLALALVVGCALAACGGDDARTAPAAQTAIYVRAEGMVQSLGIT